MEEFKIGRLRFTWKGVWATGKFYNRDAVVQYNGKGYVCLVPHTSGDFYNDINYVDELGAATPYWSLLIDGKTWKGVWTPNTYYSLGNLVAYGGTIYQCTTQHVSGPVSLTEANWTIYTRFDKWNNAWTPNTAYGLGDIVKYGGLVYRCATGHVSAATAVLGLEADQAKWSAINNGIEFTGTWTIGNRYRANDIVKNGPDLWICTAGHVATSTFDQTKWTIWMPGEEFAGSWNVSTTYQPGDVVDYGGYSYISIVANNVGNVPSTSSASWTLQTTGYEMMGEWDASTAYMIGSVVRRRGQLFSAAQDNTGQDPTLYSKTTSYTASGSSGTTLKVASTTAITVGMLVIGTGFSQGQTVVSVTDGTTLVLNQAPDNQNGTITNGQSLSFVGINYTNWTLLIPGVNWSNFWAKNTSYVVGDLAVWQNGTYRCINNHTSSANSPPSTDTTNQYWVVYVLHARKNALNSQGDIVTYQGTSTTALAIGTTDYALKITSGVPAWKQIMVVPGVYYVAPNGADTAELNADGTSKYGMTWDRPWRTIKYACQQVENGRLYPLAKSLLLANKDFLVEEMYQWMLYQKANNLAPFSTSSSFDETKTRRDAKYVIDAVIYDLSRGGNSQTVASTLAYFTPDLSDSFVNAATTAVMPYITASLARLTTLINQVINNTTITPLYQSLNNIPLEQVITQTTGGAESGVGTLASNLLSIVTTALTNKKKSSIPAANQGMTATIYVKTGTYSEDLPITIPANCAVVGDELRGSIVQPSLSIETFTKSSVAGATYTATTSANGTHSTWAFGEGTIGLVSTSLPYHSYGNSASTTDASVQTISKTWPYRGGTNISATEKSLIGSGVIGYWLNGVSIFSPSAAAIPPSGFTPVAGFNYNSGFANGPTLGYTFGADDAGGYADSTGTYQYNTFSFGDAWILGDAYVDGPVGATGTPEISSIPYLGGSILHPDGHSKILGFSLDGYPIYGPFGYSSPLESSSVVKVMTPGYALRDSSYRTGTGASNLTTYPMGCFIEDYYYAGGGDLDESNGRYCVTPDYPNGTYAYFVTVDSMAGTPVYPYVIGNHYYSTPAATGKTTSTTGTGGGIPPLGLGSYISGGYFNAFSTSGMYDNCPVQFVSTLSSIPTLVGFETANITAGQTYYVVGSSLTPTTFQVRAVKDGKPIGLDGGLGFMQVVGGNALNDMFYMQNGTGLRNMTLTGLLGTLTAENQYQTQRPTGGSFVSLDPGAGTDDTSAWIFRKSPYVQNVTNFGYGCTGLKIDGTLHDGGNKSIVCNDFTQILGDGIGIWVTGPGSLCEAVSVFAYYGYAGYFAENGGKIRATNGNSSYGTYGVIAEGYDTTETPVTANVYNRYTQAKANVQSSYGINANLLKLQYSNAGSNYVSPATNLLTYSNNFLSGWTSVGSVTLAQNVISPSSYSDGWTLTSNTSTGNSDYLYQNVTINPTGATFSGVAGSNITGSGSSATFNVTVNATSYAVSVAAGGTGYVVGNQIRIFGSQVGGIDTTNDIILTIETLTGSAIATVTTSGTVPAGSALSYTLSVHVKQVSSPIVELYAFYNGVSTKGSALQYNFNTKVLTPISSDGAGLLPTLYGVTTLENGWYRIWFSVYDLNALNTSLQFRLYPRGRNGLAGATAVYGNQVEIGTSPNFYLTTGADRYTAYADYIVSGAGTGAIIVGDEVRSSAVFQARLTDPSGSGTGGTGYLTASNNAQGGDTSSIILAQSDINTSTNYTGMRLFINSGTGAGQYGTISYYNPINKYAYLIKDTFQTLTLTASSSATNYLTLDSGADVNSLYLNQPIQFIPTYYNTTVFTTSEDQISVTATTGGVINTMTTASTARLYVNMPVTFSDLVFGGVISNYTYYISEIVDDFTFRITTTLYGDTWLLQTATGVMTMNIPSYHNFMRASSTTNMAPNMPIEFTGTALGGVTTGTLYYISDVIDSTKFTISNSLISVTATATTASTNVVTTSSTSSMKPMNPIIFSGNGFGNISPSTKYYISKIVSGTQFQITSSILSTTATATTSVSNLITVGSTVGFVPNNPVYFAGSPFGGLTNESTYYILAVNDATSFTVSSSVGGSAVSLTTSAGNMTVRTCPTANTLTTATGTLVGSSTASRFALSASTGTMNAMFSTPLFGGVAQGTTYYVKTINAGSPNTISISGTPGGSVVTLTSNTGSMQLGMAGWDHVNSGTPLAASLDSTSLYFIEPKMSFETPAFSQTLTSMVAMAIGTPYVTMGYGNNLWIAVPSGNQTIATTTDGTTWSAAALPIVRTWSAITYGNNYWVLISSGGDAGDTYSKVLYSPSAAATWKVANMPAKTTWSAVAYGEGVFVAIATGTASAAYSTNFGGTWSSASGLPSATWTGLCFGADRFVAVASGGTTAAYSINGTSWTSATLPASTAWSAVVYGNGRFVAVSSSSSAPAYSFDGITWYTSPYSVAATEIEYGQGVFVAINTSSTVAWTSEDGYLWTKRTVDGPAYGAIKFGFTATSNNGLFLTAAGTSSGSKIVAGAVAKGRPTVSSGKITAISLWEPGSGYTTTPVLSFFDPNLTTAATTDVRTSNGVLAAPTFVNRGSGYNTSSTVISINGNGYADEYQTGLSLYVNNLTLAPRPGDNLSVAGNDKVYKVTSCTVLGGTSAPNITAKLTISPEMTAQLSPTNGTAITIRQKYSQVRLTGHDYLNIGFGNVDQSNFPGSPTTTELNSANQAVETNNGRVFYTSTDQDGNFLVGGLFGVQQATGIVTLNASQFDLGGLTQLTLGGIAVGGSQVVITQFSTDPTFVANSNNIIPTQKAIKTYLTSRLSQGGSNTFTGQTTAGTVVIGGPNAINNTIPQGTAGSSVKMKNKVNINGALGGVDGNMVAYNFFTKSFWRR